MTNSTSSTASAPSAFAPRSIRAPNKPKLTKREWEVERVLLANAFPNDEGSHYHAFPALSSEHPAPLPCRELMTAIRSARADKVKHYGGRRTQCSIHLMSLTEAYIAGIASGIILVMLTDARGFPDETLSIDPSKFGYQIEDIIQMLNYAVRRPFSIVMPPLQHPTLTQLKRQYPARANGPLPIPAPTDYERISEYFSMYGCYPSRGSYYQKYYHADHAPVSPVASKPVASKSTESKPKSTGSTKAARHTRSTCSKKKGTKTNV